MELNEYLTAFKNHWLTIAIVTLLALGTAAGVTWAMPKTYEASAMIFITTESESSSSYENAQFSMQRVKSYPNLVFSPEVLGPVVESLELGMSVAGLRTKVSASNPVETVYVEVVAEANDAARSALLANSVAESLANHIRLLESSESARSIAVEPVVAVPAVQPAAPKSPRTLVNLALGALLGLSIGMIGAVSQSKFGRRLYTGADVQEASGLPLLGQIDTRTPNRTAARSKQKTHNSLAYREWWTNMLFSTGGHLPKVVLMTSAGGTSASSSRLIRRNGAQFLADMGHDVCALDTDAELDPAFTDDGRLPGFTDVLSERATLDEALRRVGPLAFIPSGRPDSSLRRIDVSARSATVVKELADRFDVVMTHAGYEPRPTSAAMLAPVADSVLILVSYRRTTASQLNTAALELRAFGIKPLGVVMLDVPSKSRSNVVPPVDSRRVYRS